MARAECCRPPGHLDYQRRSGGRRRPERPRERDCPGDRDDHRDQRGRERQHDRDRDGRCRIVRTWKGGASGKATDWSAAANWDPSGVPIPLDTVRVPATASSPVLKGDVEIARMTLSGGRLRTAGFRLKINGDRPTKFNLKDGYHERSC